MKKHFPNTLTCCNLFSGCIATYFAFQAEFSTALLFIIIGAVFDFFDGFAARLLHVSSNIGKELDSLADDVTFGFAPAAIVYSMLQVALNANPCTSGCPLTQFLPYAAFIISCFSALRLAKFNLDERQTTSFIGLPTPANALFWGSLAVGLSESHYLTETTWIPAALFAGIFISSWLLIAEIPMFALKFKSFGWNGNRLRYSFIILSIVLLITLQWIGFAAIIVFYILASLANNTFGTDIVNKEK